MYICILCGDSAEAALCRFSGSLRVALPSLSQADRDKTRQDKLDGADTDSCIAGAGARNGDAMAGHRVHRGHACAVLERWVARSAVVNSSSLVTTYRARRGLDSAADTAARADRPGTQDIRLLLCTLLSCVCVPIAP